jgi:glucokinase
VAALDVGGTTIKGAVVDRDGTVLVRRRRPTPTRDVGSDRVLTAILGAVEELTAAAPGGGGVRAVGLAVTGIVDERRGMAVHSENVGWRDVPVRSLVERATGLPVGFGHDVRAGTLAEWRLGAGRGLEDLVFVPIGTGVSAGIIVQGRPLTGDGHAGEIGHVNVGHGEPCACGGRGCVEAVASAAAIARRYTALSGRPVSGASDVAERLAAGDPAARRVWADATEALALALAWTSVVLAPQAIVLGGGLARAGGVLFEPVRQALDHHLGMVRRPRLLPATLRDEAGFLGAALLAWEVLEQAGTAGRRGSPVDRETP